jgi:nucleoside-diphosphate-sugar epimerase
MKIVISGVTGFLGSHLARYFIAKGHRIYGIKRHNSSLNKLKGITSKIFFINVDSNDWSEQLKAVTPDVIIHTACSYGRRGETISSLVQTNLVFALQLLEAAIDSGASCFINADTAFTKNVNPYALSKHQFKQWGCHFQDKIKFINLRIEHMYGVGDDEYKFVKWLVNQIHHQAEKIPLTPGTQLRDFIYIDDAISAFDLILENQYKLPQFVEIDLTTGVFIQVKDFIYEVISAYSLKYTSPKTILDFGAIPYRKNDPMVPDMDPSYLKELGWKAKIGHQEGILKLLEELE